MLSTAIVRIVEASYRRAWLTLALALLVALVSSVFAARHFAINTNTDDLISDKLDWRQRQIDFDTAFPQLYQRVLVVIDAQTPERAQAAADTLQAALLQKKDVIEAVERTDSLPYFRRNAFLFLPVEQVQRSVTGALNAQPLLATLSSDPSLRGLAIAMGLFAQGVQRGMTKTEELAPVLNTIAGTFDRIIAGQPAPFSWQPLISGAPPTQQDLRRFIMVKPVLDFSALEPGHRTTEAIRAAARDAGLTPENGTTVRLTGDVALADEEFATVAEGAWINNLGTVLIVAFLLWAALRSGKIVVAILLSVAVGLVVTAALGLMMVGALNLISIAFAVLFVGIGADFGIQFSVRYRAERHAHDDLRGALSAAALRAGRPLALAATATACGFLAFLPTVYRGVSELGLIAGVGMIVAFLSSITVLPAALMIFQPGGEPDEIGYRFLAPVDRFLSDKRWFIIGGTLLVVLAGTPLLTRLHFDFNPLNLRSANVESVSTLRDLKRDPNTSYDSVSVMSPTLDEARSLSDRLRQLPQVQRVTDLESFVPQDQQQKLAVIAQASPLLRALERPKRQPATDAETVQSLRNVSALLIQTAGANSGPGAEAMAHVGHDLEMLVSASPATRDLAARTMLEPFDVTLASLRDALQAAPVTLADIPDELRRQWIAPDQRARIEVLPRGNANDNAVLRRFTDAVTQIAPDAAGAPIAIQGAGDTIVRAFIEAGAWALLSICILLFAVLRRITDVLLTLVPLILAGVVTLEICVLIDLPLNFANIIALPLLLGLGVAFKIYFVMAWRAGVVNLLQSSLTRAVVFSAMTTATAFGSLWLSNHPGTSSMGTLLALSLVCTLAAAVLFQPALMGPPRTKAGEEVQ